MMKKSINGLFALILLITTLALAGCGSQSAQTPTPDPKDVYTQVAQTVQAQITGNAKLTPQATSTPKPTETQAPSATLRPSSTVFGTQQPTSLTPVKTGTAGTAVSLTPQKTGGTPVLPLATATFSAGVATQPAATSPDKMAYVSQSVADGASFSYGQSFSVVYTLQNIGTTTWDNTYLVRLFAGERMGSVDGSIEQTVKPGAQAKIKIDLTAPNALGEYTAVWVLTNSEGRNFGSFTLTIKVK